MTTEIIAYTTRGDVRGFCEHAHTTYEAAEACRQSDADGCASQGGYSDRCVIGLAADGDEWIMESVPAFDNPLNDSEYDAMVGVPTRRIGIL